jgi:hypothetical protein
MPLLHFYNNYHENPPQKQAGCLWLDIMTQLNRGYRVGIVYAANDMQAKAIYQGYYQSRAPKIVGHRQAVVFGLISDYINGALLGDRIHILPIATSLTGGEDKGNNCVSESHIMRDLQNIKDHLDSRWVVFVLTNRELKPKEQSAVVQKFQIGGGASKNFYTQLYLSFSLMSGKKVSPGHFIENMLDAFELGYQDDTQQNINSNSSIKEWIRQKLPLKKSVPFGLKHYLLEALASHHLKLDTTELISANLDANYNLQIICANEFIQKRIFGRLDNYAAKKVLQLEKNNSNDNNLAKENNKFIITLPYSKVVSLLRGFCQLPIDKITLHYEQEIIFHNAHIQKCSILPQTLLVNQKPYTLEACENKKLFCNTIQQWHNLLIEYGLWDNEERVEPDNIIVALREIMSNLPLEKKPNEKSFEYITPLWGIRALDNFSYKNCHYQTIWNLIQTENDQGKYLDKIHPQITNILRYHYLSMAIPTYRFFNHITVDDCIKKSMKAVEVMQFSSKISSFIQNDLLSENRIEIRALKLWCYIQIGLQAYLDGNHFLVHAMGFTLDLIATTLTSTHQLISKESQNLLSYLKNKTGEQTLVQLSLNYRGICIPQIGAFTGLIKIAQENNGLEQAVNYTKERLEPLLKPLHNYTPGMINDDTLLRHIHNQVYSDEFTIMMNRLGKQEKIYINSNDNSVFYKNMMEKLDKYSLMKDIFDVYARATGILNIYNPITNSSQQISQILDNHQQFFSNTTLFTRVIQNEDWSLLEKLLQNKFIYIDEISLNGNNLKSLIEKLPITSQIKCSSLLHTYSNISIVDTSSHNTSSLNTYMSSPWQSNALIISSSNQVTPTIPAAAMNPMIFFASNANANAFSSHHSYNSHEHNQKPVLNNMQRKH